MSLINCPECKKQISDKSKICVACGFPINEFLKKEAEEKKKYICIKCKTQNKIGSKYCFNCGNSINYTANKEEPKANNSKKEVEEVKEEDKFNGIYRYSFWGNPIEVYCPRCGSENCSYFTEQKIIPGKTKTKYTANLNPLKPFTLVNKKEKIVRKELEYTESKISCNDCGKIFY